MENTAESRSVHFILIRTNTYKPSSTQTKWRSDFSTTYAKLNILGIHETQANMYVLVFIFHILLQYAVENSASKKRLNAIKVVLVRNFIVATLVISNKNDG